MKFPARIISQGGKDPHLVWEKETISPGDTIIDVEAFFNGYADSVRTCEDFQDAEYCNNSGGGYKKLICGPDKIGYLMVPGIVHHDHVRTYIRDCTVEELHPDTISEILSSGGECEIYVFYQSSEFSTPVPFLVDGKVLIFKK